MIWPLIATLAVFAAAIAWTISDARRGYDITIDGLFAIMAATIVALVVWLIWALRR